MDQETHETPGPRIEIASRNVMIDRKADIRLRGFKPHAKVTVTTETMDDDGRHWQGVVPYTLNPQGCLEIASAESDGESFDEIDPWEIFDSMRPVDEPDEPVPLFAKTTTDPLLIEIRARAANGDSARGSLRLHVFNDATTVREEVRDGPLQGTLFCPTGDGPFPVVICLGGSDGWFTEPRPALLASHGIATFSVAYFGRKPLTEELCQVPLEFFDRAVAFLEAYPAVDARRMGIYGYSKGGELALLLASRTERVRAVAAYSPSSVVWQSPKAGAPKSSWTADKVPLPFMPMHFSGMKLLKLMSGRPIAFREVYEQGMQKHPEKREKTRIPVENIHGPVFLVSGTEDAVWPSDRMADAVEASLKAAGVPVTHLKYRGAGHLTTLPGLPAPEIMDTLIFGGSSSESSRALEDAWQKMVAFFTETL
ncbi:dienelactone hydrolase family protein [Methanogenium sp. S4BF]|uniref:acyl-CoA thioester hydrolase/BAAT C-terminal domain-containing protein n=1 Tax=Methanogenium sp. S4BF TaxID=1789226 RepID=UPI0024168B07|nr:acyl-CoA thioester hydrolase/BAAT C-terminal domain-containing protein [Methanogenium sp. S4BF]WFN33831.1 dienelactone hydrolase family protein [Methanogenium sp. S4BF]